jgi:hypothetical protein
MIIHFVTDEPTKVPTVRAMVEPQFHVAPQLSEGGETQINPNNLLMVDADLRRMRVEPFLLGGAAVVNHE